MQCEKTYRKEHVFLVLVHSSRVRHRVGVFNDRHRLSYKNRFASVTGHFL